MNVTPARMRRGKDCLNPLERPPTVIKIGDEEYSADSCGVITLPDIQISIDDILDEDSTNPVQNKVIALKIDDIIDSIDAIEDELGDATIPGTVRGDIAGVNGRVDSIEDEIGSESDPGSILYKIHGNENDISGIQTHLDTVDGIIAAHATAINDKAEKTSVNALDNRVTAAETALTNKENIITGSVITPTIMSVGGITVVDCNVYKYGRIVALSIIVQSNTAFNNAQIVSNLPAPVNVPKEVSGNSSIELYGDGTLHYQCSGAYLERYFITYIATS